MNKRNFINVEMAIDVVSKLKSNEVLMDLVNTSFTDEVIQELARKCLIERVFVRVTRNEYHANKKLDDNKTKNIRYQCTAIPYGSGVFGGYYYYRIDYKLPNKQIFKAFRQRLEQQA